MQIQPTSNRILAKLHIPESPLIIPEGAEESLQPHIEITRIGPDVKTVKVGDLCLYDPRLAMKLMEDGEARLLMFESSILATYIQVASDTAKGG